MLPRCYMFVFHVTYFQNVPIKILYAFISRPVFVTFAGLRIVVRIRSSCICLFMAYNLVRCYMGAALFI